MADKTGLWAILILVGAMIFALWLFFDVLGFTPAAPASTTAAGSQH